MSNIPLRQRYEPMGGEGDCPPIVTFNRKPVAPVHSDQQDDVSTESFVDELTLKVRSLLNNLDDPEQSTSCNPTISTETHTITPGASNPPLFSKRDSYVYTTRGPPTIGQPYLQRQEGGICQNPPSPHVQFPIPKNTQQYFSQNDLQHAADVSTRRDMKTYALNLNDVPANVKLSISHSSGDVRSMAKRLEGPTSYRSFAHGLQKTNRGVLIPNEPACSSQGQALSKNVTTNPDSLTAEHVADCGSRSETETERSWSEMTIRAESFEKPHDVSSSTTLLFVKRSDSSSSTNSTSPVPTNYYPKSHETTTVEERSHSMAVEPSHNIPLNSSDGCLYFHAVGCEASQRQDRSIPNSCDLEHTEFETPPLSASSFASSRRLEWDNAADIGYNFFMVNPASELRRQIPNTARSEPEGISLMNETATPISALSSLPSFTFTSLGSQDISSLNQLQSETSSNDNFERSSTPGSLSRSDSKKSVIYNSFKDVQLVRSNSACTCQKRALSPKIASCPELTELKKSSREFNESDMVAFKMSKSEEKIVSKHEAFHSRAAAYFARSKTPQALDRSQVTSKSRNLSVFTKDNQEAPEADVLCSRESYLRDANVSSSMLGNRNVAILGSFPSNVRNSGVNSMLDASNMFPQEEIIDISDENQTPQSKYISKVPYLYKDNNIEALQSKPWLLLSSSVANPTDRDIQNLSKSILQAGHETSEIGTADMKPHIRWYPFSSSANMQDIKDVSTQTAMSFIAKQTAEQSTQLHTTTTQNVNLQGTSDTALMSNKHDDLSMIQKYTKSTDSEVIQTSENNAKLARALIVDQRRGLSALENYKRLQTTPSSGEVSNVQYTSHSSEFTADGFLNFLQAYQPSTADTAELLPVLNISRNTLSYSSATGMRNRSMENSLHCKATTSDSSSAATFCKLPASDSDTTRSLTPNSIRSSYQASRLHFPVSYEPAQSSHDLMTGPTEPDLCEESLKSSPKKEPAVLMQREGGGGESRSDSNQRQSTISFRSDEVQDLALTMDEGVSPTTGSSYANTGIQRYIFAFNRNSEDTLPAEKSETNVERKSVPSSISKPVVVSELSRLYAFAPESSLSHSQSDMRIKQNNSACAHNENVSSKHTEASYFSSKDANLLDLLSQKQPLSFLAHADERGKIPKSHSDPSIFNTNEKPELFCDTHKNEVDCKTLDSNSNIQEISVLGEFNKSETDESEPDAITTNLQGVTSEIPLLIPFCQHDVTWNSHQDPDITPGVVGSSLRAIASNVRDHSLRNPSSSADPSSRTNGNLTIASNACAHSLGDHQFASADPSSRTNVNFTIGSNTRDYSFSNVQSASATTRTNASTTDDFRLNFQSDSASITGDISSTKVKPIVENKSLKYTDLISYYENFYKTGRMNRTSHEQKSTDVDKNDKVFSTNHLDLVRMDNFDAASESSEPFSELYDYNPETKKSCNSIGVQVSEAKNTSEMCPSCHRAKDPLLGTKELQTEFKAKLNETLSKRWASLYKSNASYCIFPNGCTCCCNKTLQEAFNFHRSELIQRIEARKKDKTRTLAFMSSVPLVPVNKPKSKTIAVKEMNSQRSNCNKENNRRIRRKSNLSYGNPQKQSNRQKCLNKYNQVMCKIYSQRLKSETLKGNVNHKRHEILIKS